MPSDRISMSARYVFPVEGPPIAGGRIAIAGGRIEEVGPADGRPVDLDLGNVAILPGFVNAHTHLELGPIDDGTVPIVDATDWLRRVIASRRMPEAEPPARIVDANLREAIAAGTTLLADITTAGQSWCAIREAGVRAVVFAEVLGLKRERALGTSHEAWEWIGAARAEAAASGRLRIGLSPHAPYSTAGWLYERAATSGLPLTTHLAEFPGELELLASRSGPFRAFLEDLGAWDEDWEPIGPRPADYVRRRDLRRADWLVAHGTYFDPSEFWQLRPAAAPDGQRVAIAYCPRTHARFGHAPHPFRAMLERGVVVCLGTDSRASSPSLSVLDETRFLHRQSPDLGGALLLTMATLFGAWALRSELETGSLKPGKFADLAVVALPDRETADPHDLLLESDLPVRATMIGGRFVSGDWSGP